MVMTVEKRQVMLMLPLMMVTAFRRELRLRVTWTRFGIHGFERWG